MRQPAIEANNFELKPALITMVQQHQFIRHPSEDPNEHMGRFMRMDNTVKLNGVRPKVIKLQQFSIFTERCGSKLGLVTASWIREQLARVGGSLHEQILPSCPHF